MFSLVVIKHKTYGHAAYAQYHKAASRRQKLSLTTDRGRCMQRQQWQFSLLRNHKRTLIKIYYSTHSIENKYENNNKTREQNWK